MSWIRVLTAVAVYLVIALSASAVLSRRGSNLTEMEGRGATAVLIVGTLANLVVLAAVLIMVVLADHQRLEALGLDLDRRDALLAGVMGALTVTSAAAFLAVLRGIHLLDVKPKALPPGSTGRLLTMATALLVVSLQEEVLYRGYITLNLIDHGPVVVLLISTVVFTAIHFPTNRVSLAQIAGWLLGGFLLGWVYLATGSIWVPVWLHFAIDATNVLVFGVAGELAVFDLSRPLSDMDRTVYRAGYAVLIGAVLVGVYGLRLAPRWTG